MSAVYLSDEEIRGLLNDLECVWVDSPKQNASSQRSYRKRRVELADPYFLPYGWLRPRCKIELEFHIMAMPFTVREGDLIV